MERRSMKRVVIVLAVLSYLGLLLACPNPNASTYTVIYNYNGATGGSVPADTNRYQPGATVIAMGNANSLSRTGYSFTGWNTKPDQSGTSYSAGATFSMGTADMILYAEWTANSCTVTFDSLGGSAVSPQNVDYGSKVTAPASPTRTGYAFSGWYKESGCTNAWSFASDTVTADVTLYAKWIANAHTVTFNSQGGSSVSPQIVNDSGLAAAPILPTWAGHTFGGWYKESGCTNAWSFASDTVTADVTLYAKWTVISCTVTFDSQGGSSVSAQAVDYGSKVSAPTPPTRSGCTFSGWYKESGCTNSWSFASDTVTADMTLYAKWVNSFRRTPIIDGSIDAGWNAAATYSGAHSWDSVSSPNSLHALYLAYDDSNLYVAISGTVTSPNAIVVYIDTNYDASHTGGVMISSFTDNTGLLDNAVSANPVTQPDSFSAAWAVGTVGMASVSNSTSDTAGWRETGPYPSNFHWVTGDLACGVGCFESRVPLASLFHGSPPSQCSIAFVVRIVDGTGQYFASDAIPEEASSDHISSVYQFLFTMP